MRPFDLDRRLASLASLGDPLRRDLYHLVAGRDRRGSRGEDPLRSALAEHGDEPYDDQGVLRLRNCPFGRLTEAHRDLVCSANLAFLEGMAEALPRAGRRAVLDPRPGRCCVALVS